LPYLLFVWSSKLIFKHQKIPLLEKNFLLF
jgi:hypothetical protein